MINPLSVRQTIQARLRRFTFSLERQYRSSPLRNAIVAMRSPKPAERFPPDCRRFAIFLVPGWDLVNGGIMSICSIANETRKLLSANGVSVAVCTGFGSPRMLRFTKFDNDIELLAFSDLLPWFPSGSEVLIHVPELSLQRYVFDRLDAFRSRSDIKWRFNILLQNIERIPSEEFVRAIQRVGFTTATIAHKASTAAARNLGCPIHYLSWFISAEDFQRVDYSKKKKLIAISPDFNPARDQIVHRMAEALPDHEIIEIRSMTYRQYKNVIRDAKFMFTFGEGLDGYFIESIFSGALAMAIFEDHYFTSEYRNLPGVFGSSGAAIASVGDFLNGSNDAAIFQAIVQSQYEVASRTFRRELYQANVSSFYSLYFPEWHPSSVLQHADSSGLT